MITFKNEKDSNIEIEYDDISKEIYVIVYSKKNPNKILYTEYYIKK
jgi:hypothetical protein